MDTPQSIPRKEPGFGPGATSTTYSQQRQPNLLPARNKASKPSHIEVTPFSNFQPQSPSTNAPNRASPPVKRKPLPPSASPSTPKLPSLSSGGKVIAVGVEHPEENQQHISEYPTTAPAPWNQPAERSSPHLVVRDLDQFPRGLSPNVPQSPGFTPFHKLPPDQARDILQSLDTENYSPSTLSHARNSDPPTGSPVIARPHGPWGHQIQRSVTMPLKSGGPGRLQMPPPNGLNTPQRQNSASTKISSFFGWKGSNNSNNYNPTSPIAETSPTTISDRSSIGGSPNGAHTHATSVSSHYGTKPMPAAIDVPRANAPAPALFSGSSFPQAPPTPAMSIQVNEMEEELRELSEELANSIRREMELEEQIERLQAEGPNALDNEKRTSDYFSDSGTNSSARDMDGADAKEDELRHVKRQSAQEKAQMKVSVSQRVQEERNKRKALEEHVKNLEAHIQTLELQAGGGDRISELQNALEDNRRRLVEEKRHKENYEDLIAALRVDLVQHKNERDNLKEEIVPQLKARVEGLEADAAEAQRLTYENARLQQEIQAAKGGRFESIAEEGGSTAPKVGLSRSTSLIRGTKPARSLPRSNSLSSKPEPRESREALAERVKEIESQRDALHQALKSLLDRQKFQAHEFEKRLSAVEQERDRALEASSPRRRGYEKEVTDLRYEINQLRKRADDALEQKFQCEKGLGGLKKDLDRAEQETSSLRQLLAENDILVPDLSSLPAAPHATSETLARAYRELRAAQAMSIERLRELKDIELSPIDDKKTNETLDILLKSMSNAEAERDYAQKQAESYRARAESLQDAKDFQEGENFNLAKDLKASASRVEALSSQVKRQLTANSDLRERLAEAVGKGEREQKQSATRINGLQSKLKGLEDRLMAAQQHSEDSIQLHEDDVRIIRKSSNSQLQRLKPPAQRIDVSGGSSLKPPRSPLSPRSPRLDNTTSGAGMSMTEALKTEYLEQRVKELESALSDAGSEMREVVQKMNEAQIEVMELQSARDEAMKRTRMLQNQIIAENENVGSLMKSMPR